VISKGCTMRVALLHNRNKDGAGADSVVELEAELLERAGVEVELLAFEGQGEPCGLNPKTLYSLWRSPHNARSERRVREFMRDTHCDVAHVHSWFPLMTPAAHAALADCGVPVVQSLHDYRLGCANGAITRDGASCELCLDGDRSHSVAHGCLGGSGLLTRMWKRLSDDIWAQRRLIDSTDLFIAPSEYTRFQHRRMGLPAERIEVVPHPVPDVPFSERSNPTAEAGGIFVGRLSAEKGLDVLLEAWSECDLKLTLIGTGAEPEQLRAVLETSPHIQLARDLPRDEVMRRMARAGFLVSPHRSPGTFGLVIAEAMACGRPVICSDIGAARESVVHGETGLLVRPGDPASLRHAIAEITEDDQGLARMGAAARRSFEEQLRTDRHAERLIGLFGELLGHRRARRAA